MKIKSQSTNKRLYTWIHHTHPNPNVIYILNVYLMFGCSFLSVTGADSCSCLWSESCGNVHPGWVVPPETHPTLHSGFRCSWSDWKCRRRSRCSEGLMNVQLCIFVSCSSCSWKYSTTSLIKKKYIFVKKKMWRKLSNFCNIDGRV